MTRILSTGVPPTLIRKSVISGYLTHKLIRRTDNNQDALAAAAQHSLKTQNKWYFLLSESQATGIARSLRNAYHLMKKNNYEVTDHVHQLSGSDEEG